MSLIDPPAVPDEPAAESPLSAPAIDVSPAGVGAAAAPPRRFLVGAVTHGYQFDGRFPAWVKVMTDALGTVGYHAAIPFDWAARSNAPAQGMAVQAGRDLAGKLATVLRQLLPVVGPGDGVDVHLNGHSRGTVVMSQAATALQEMDLGGLLPQLTGGRLKLTLLDPHPAHNTHTFGLVSKGWFSASDAAAGTIALRAYSHFQDAARDPEVTAPDRADEVEVYSQHTSHFAAADSLEQILNLWGEVPVLGRPARYCDLTGTANGHLEVHDWYQQHVVPGLASGSPVPCPGSTSVPAATMAVAFAVAPAPVAAAVPGDEADRELQALYPKEVDDRDVAVELLRKHAAAENALAQGRTSESIGRLNDLSQFIQTHRGRHITPRAADFFEDNVQTLLRGLP